MKLTIIAVIYLDTSACERNVGLSWMLC